MKKVILPIIFSTAMVTTGCGSSIAYLKGNGGYMEMSGDAEGWEALSDMIVGIADEANSPPEQKNAYWQNAELKTRGKTMVFSSRPGGKKNE